jgi:hypothetical protein
LSRHKSTASNIDMLTNTERMKIAIQLAKTHRRLNSPDGSSLMFIELFKNQLRLDGFTEEELRYAILMAYGKRIRKYESNGQYSEAPVGI